MGGEGGEDLVLLALVAEDLIRCDGHTVTVIDEQRLIDLSQYRALDGDLDHDWLRRVAAPMAASLRMG